MLHRSLVMGDARTRAWGWGLTAAVVVTAVVMLRFAGQVKDSRVPTKAETDSGAVSGHDGPSGIGTSGAVAPGQAASSPVAQLSSLLGNRPLKELIGEQISFRVDEGGLVPDVAFWVGAGEHRLLVVPQRDRRSSTDRQVGRPSADENIEIRPNEPIVITGVVERIPYAEATYSWNLTRADIAELVSQGAYVRALAVRPVKE
jgi:hypothetical protein